MSFGPTVYLPIAEMGISLFAVAGVGLSVGWLSGMLGIGGGFVVTPLLTFLGATASYLVLLWRMATAVKDFARFLATEPEAEPLDVA